jgi:hypothetical protein
LGRIPDHTPSQCGDLVLETLVLELKRIPKPDGLVMTNVMDNPIAPIFEERFGYCRGRFRKARRRGKTQFL